MRLRAAAAVVTVVFAVARPGAVSAAPGPTQPITADDCKRAPGADKPQTNWPVKRLDLGEVSTVTQGRDVRTGAPVRVAVLDSGLDRFHPQLRGMDARAELDAIPHDPGAKFSDCAGHGTQVTAIIAAQRDSSVPSFYGIAPQVSILPIKLANTDAVAAADVARAIDLAVDANAQIANLSLSLPTDVPAVRAAVARAQRAGMLIVAAAGNDGGQANRLAQYPAAYSASFDNVIAVAATQTNDTPADFSAYGPYVDVAAPGKGVQTIGVHGGYLALDGTSFATPYVTGAAALVLAANPGLSAAQVRARLETTADPPPATVPSPRWGYGIINPYLAVTAVRTDAPTKVGAAARPGPLHLGAPPPAPDRTLAHVAVGAGLGLLGLAALVITGAAVLRGDRRQRRA